MLSFPWARKIIAQQCIHKLVGGGGGAECSSSNTEDWKSLAKGILAKVIQAGVEKGLHTWVAFLFLVMAMRVTRSGEPAGPGKMRYMRSRLLTQHQLSPAYSSQLPTGCVTGNERLLLETPGF